jgi:hypothetical protein
LTVADYVVTQRFNFFFFGACFLLKSYLLAHFFEEDDMSSKQGNASIELSLGIEY